MSGYASGSNPTAYSRITGKILKRIRAIEREPGRFLIARPERTILTVREKKHFGRMRIDTLGRSINFSWARQSPEHAIRERAVAEVFAPTGLCDGDSVSDGWFTR